MRTIKLLDGYRVSCIVCDECGDILEENPMIVDGAELCARCFGRWYRRTSAIPPEEPVKEGK